MHRESSTLLKRGADPMVKDLPKIRRAKEPTGVKIRNRSTEIAEVGRGLRKGHASGATPDKC